MGNWIGFILVNCFLIPPHPPRKSPIEPALWQFLTLDFVDFTGYSTLILFSLPPSGMLLPVWLVMGFLNNLDLCIHMQAKPPWWSSQYWGATLLQGQNVTGVWTSPVFRSWVRLLLIVLMKMWISSHSSSSAPHTQQRSLLNPPVPYSPISNMNFPFLLLSGWSDFPIFHGLPVYTTKASNSPWVFLLLTAMFSPAVIALVNHLLRDLNTMDLKEKEVTRRKL